MPSLMKTTGFLPIVDRSVRGQYPPCPYARCSWIGVAIVTLSVPTQIWYDPQSVAQERRFYRVQVVNGE